MPIHVRDAGVADAPLIALLGVAVWVDTYATAGLTAATAAYVTQKFSLPSVEALLSEPSARVFVADLDGSAVGYAAVRHGSPCPSAPELDCELSTLYVLRRLHGRRVGSALLARCRDHAAAAWGVGRLWLRANSRNADALGFYGRLGMERIGSVWVTLDGVTNENFILADRGGG